MYSKMESLILAETNYSLVKSHKPFIIQQYEYSRNKKKRG